VIPMSTIRRTCAAAALTAAAVIGPAVASAAPATAAPAAPCGAGAKVCVDLSSEQAWLMKDGQVTYGPVPIDAGTKSHPTPAGTFHVLFKDINYHSTEFHNAPMPYSVFFYPGDAFHEGSLNVASHGCIHLSASAAKTFYNTLQPGDEVQILN